ncbi:MAG: hypothetical protein ACK5LC_14935 [Coprobacillaceae bacterium]
MKKNKLFIILLTFSLCLIGCTKSVDVEDIYLVLDQEYQLTNSRSLSTNELSYITLSFNNGEDKILYYVNFDSIDFRSSKLNEPYITIYDGNNFTNENNDDDTEIFDNFSDSLHNDLTIEIFVDWIKNICQTEKERCEVLRNDIVNRLENQGYILEKTDQNKPIITEGEYTIRIWGERVKVSKYIETDSETNNSYDYFADSIYTNYYEGYKLKFSYDYQTDTYSSGEATSEEYNEVLMIKEWFDNLLISTNLTYEDLLLIY